MISQSFHTLPQAMQNTLENDRGESTRVLVVAEAIRAPIQLVHLRTVTMQKLMRVYSPDLNSTYLFICKALL